MLKNYICFGCAAAIFALSIVLTNELDDANKFILPFSMGVLFTSFLYMGGITKNDFKERAYKKIILEQKNVIEGLLSEKDGKKPVDSYLNP